MLQIQCKLFVFDKASQSWVERGRGLLRLNDMASTDDGTLQSRLGEHWIRVDPPRGGPGSHQTRSVGATAGKGHGCEQGCVSGPSDRGLLLLHTHSLLKHLSWKQYSSEARWRQEHVSLGCESSEQQALLQCRSELPSSWWGLVNMVSL